MGAYYIAALEQQNTPLLLPINESELLEELNKMLRGGVGYFPSLWINFATASH